MVYGLPEGEILDSHFDIAFVCGSSHPDSDLQGNDVGVIHAISWVTELLLNFERRLFKC